MNTRPISGMTDCFITSKNQHTVIHYTCIKFNFIFVYFFALKELKHLKKPIKKKKS